MFLNISLNKWSRCKQMPWRDQNTCFNSHARATYSKQPSNDRTLVESRWWLWSWSASFSCKFIYFCRADMVAGSCSQPELLASELHIYRWVHSRLSVQFRHLLLLYIRQWMFEKIKTVLIDMTIDFDI